MRYFIIVKANVVGVYVYIYMNKFQKYNLIKEIIEYDVIFDENYLMFKDILMILVLYSLMYI